MKEFGIKQITGTLSILLLVCFVSSTACHSETTHIIKYSSCLTDANDGPLTDRVAYTISLKDKKEGSDPLGSETHDVFVQDGLFIVIPASVTPSDRLFDNSYYLWIAVDEYPDMPHSYPFISAAYALTSSAGAISGPHTEKGTVGAQGRDL